MARINPDLLGALQRKLKVGQARVYTLIQQVASQHRVPRHLAALILAGDNGISFQKYATKEDLSELRGQGASGHSGTSAPALAMPRSSVRRAKAKPAPRPKDNTVFVVHGRDEALRKSMFAFLRALGLKPMEWGDALATAKGANPQIESIIDSAMSKVQAVVVLFSPDEEARLKESLCGRGEKRTEGALAGQPRPNVLFEAGLALGRHPEKTLLVQVGKVRGFSDIAGRHLARLTNDTSRRNDVANRLEQIGCVINRRGDDWMTEGDFAR
ncbi:nucleotide-binding protein [Bradyrhizobium diazoefficiens]|uniref:TIR domain-containing protein n=1 Tax=Bradyrhizobium diazoefficiens TaxID=1355477 RepID=UPI00190B20F6|nr:nucleotide-binding protein [Bradyrhizobium diazoefficiens]QQO33506.1 nucleotide-binding protein [Bradyrhizobium diazoefficiens]